MKKLQVDDKIKVNGKIFTVLSILNNLAYCECNHVDMRLYKEIFMVDNIEKNFTPELLDK